MSEFNIEVESGASVRLQTAGKYCDRNIVVTATDGNGGYDQGFVDGRQAEYDAFWDAHLNGGNRQDFEYAYIGSGGWNEQNFKPNRNIIPTNAQYMFAYNGHYATEQYLTDIKGLFEQAGVVLDTSKATNMTGFCYLAKAITRLPSISHESATEVRSTFVQNFALQSIDEFILREDGTNTFATGTASPFTRCDKLSHMIVRGTIGNNGFDVHWSPLDHESRLSIFNALKDYSGSGTAYVVTLNKLGESDTTDEEKAIAIEKGWTIAWN